MPLIGQPLEQPQEITLEQVQLAMQGDVDTCQEIYTAVLLRSSFSNSATQFIIHNCQPAGLEGQFLYYLQLHANGIELEKAYQLLDYLVEQQFPLAIHLRALEMLDDGVLKYHKAAPYDPEQAKEMVASLKNSKYRLGKLLWCELYQTPDRVIREYLLAHQHFRETQPLLADRSLWGAFVILEKNLTPANFKIVHEFCSTHPRLMTMLLLFAQKHIPKAEVEQFQKAVGASESRMLFSLEKYQKVMHDVMKILNMVDSRLNRFGRNEYAGLEVGVIAKELQSSKNAAKNLDDINEFIKVHKDALEYYVEKNPKFKTQCEKFLASMKKTSEDLQKHQNACQKVVDAVSQLASDPKDTALLESRVSQLSQGFDEAKSEANRLLNEAIKYSTTLLHSYNLLVQSCIDVCPTLESSNMSPIVLSEKPRKWGVLKKQLEDCILTEEEIKKIHKTNNVKVIYDKIRKIDIVLKTQQEYSNEKIFPENNPLEKLLARVKEMRTDLENTYGVSEEKVKENRFEL